MTGDDRVVIRKRIQATREELFDAWTDPDSMREWMCPGNIVSAEVRIEARVGGTLLIIMRSPTEAFEQRGEFRVLERPSKLVITWTAKATDGQPTLLTVEFLEVSRTETELVLTHQHIPRQEVRDQYQGGWSQILDRLENHLQRS